jgi:hypothetical protein
MNTITKSIIIGISSAAAFVAAISLFRPNATAQPPTTVRTIAASPQGEWIALLQPQGNNIEFDWEDLEQKKGFRYAVLYHTGTGKSRIIKYKSYGGISDYQIIEAP